MTAVLFGLEVHAVRRARWFGASLALAAGLVGFFVLVAARESAVLGFTGFGRVMGGIVQASLLLLPLLGLLSTSQAVTSARQSGVLEWYLAQPTTRAACFWSVLLPRMLAVTAPSAGAVVVLGVVAAALGQPVSVGLLASFFTLLVGQGACFAGLGMWISTVSRSSEQALLRAVAVWVAVALLVDFAILGALLRWDLPAAAVFALAGLNPIQAGRIGIVAVVDPQMGAIGPVGTWAITTLGAPVTVAWGLGWPVLLATVAVLGARRAFLRRDVL